MLVWRADLRRQARSPLAAYLRRYMTPEMQALRLAGAVVMLAGGWSHSVPLVGIGLLAIAFAWLRGVISP